jgi:hypothetical protein
VRTKQKTHSNFSIVVMEVNKLSTHLGAHPTVHANEVIVISAQLKKKKHINGVQEFVDT